MAVFEQEKERQSKKQYAYQYYLNMGYRPIEAAAIVGNLDIESGGFSPDVIQDKRRGDKGTAAGIAQWRLDRLDRLKSKYKNYKDFDSQLDFVHWELNNTHKSALEKMRKASNVEEATSAFTWDYERPNKDLAHFDKRLKSAKSLVGESNDNSSAVTESFNIDRSYYVEANPLTLLTSTSKVEEEEEKPEVVEAKKEIAEKSFEEDFKNILTKNNPDTTKDETVYQQQAPQEDFMSDEAYNYIELDPGYNFEEEQFQDGGKKRNRIVEATKKATDSFITGQLLNNIPYGDTVYDSWNIVNSYKQGDPLKVLPNTVGALIPGVSGKVIEAYTDEFLPKTPDNIKKKVKDVLKGKRATPEQIQEIQDSVDWSKFWTGLKGDIMSVLPRRIEDGGEIDSYQAGGSYQDSLRLYNQSEEMIKKISDPRFARKFIIISKDKEQRKALNRKVKTLRDAEFDDNSEPINPNIKPIGYGTGTHTFNNRWTNDGEIKVNLRVPIYKKPTGKVKNTEKVTVDRKPVQQINNSLVPKDLVIKNLDINLEYPNKQAEIPKYYNVTDKINKPVGGSQSDYRWYPADGQPLQELAPEPYNSRIMIPQYDFGGEIIEDEMGQWAHPGKITKINSNNITMKGVNYPVLGISNLGDMQMMQPGGEYKFKGDYVIEIPKNKLRKNRFNHE